MSRGRHTLQLPPRLSRHSAAMESTPTVVPTTAAPTNTPDVTEDIVEFPLVRDDGLVPSLDTTAFLRVMYNLNAIYSKFVTVGLFKEFDFRLGVLFHKQGNRKYVLMDRTQFAELDKEEPSITFALRNIKAIKKRKFDVSGLKVIIRNIYFKPHVEIRDLARKSCFLFTEQEWTAFVNLSPCVSRYVEQLSNYEGDLVEHIERVMRSDSVYVPPPQRLTGWDADRLQDEVVMYKNTKPTVN